jgi:large subunit ribosomal protein L29
MRKNELKQLPMEELKVQLRDAQEEMGNLRFQLALHQLDNPVKVRLLRKEIARIRTLLREQELGLGQKKAQK